MSMPDEHADLPEFDGLLTDTELRKLEQLHADCWSSISTNADRSASRAEIRAIAEYRFRDRERIDAKVMAHAIAYDHLGPDSKYRVLIDWMNAWIQRVESAGEFGSFKEMRLIGKGSFGAVFRAKEGHRSVAIKMARIEVIPSEWQTLEADVTRYVQLLTEVRRHSQINVKGCVTVLDGTTGTPSDLSVDAMLAHLAERPIWFSMQLVNGPGNLRGLMDEQSGGMDWDSAMRLMRPVAQTLSHLHRATPADREAQNLIHKDLKPENILIDEHDEPWVADFGLATPRSRQRLVGNRVSGTARYMAPEQFTTEFVNAQTDIWAWGVIIYELVAGRLPFHGDTLEALRDDVVAARPDALSVHARSDLPPYADELVAKCLRPNRDGNESRFSSFAELLSYLKIATTKDKKNTVLRQLAVPASAVAFLVLVAVAAVMFKQANSDRKATDNQVKTDARLMELESDIKRLREEAKSLAAASGILSSEQEDLAKQLLESEDSELKRIGSNALKNHRIAEKIDYFMIRLTWLTDQMSDDLMQQVSVNPDFPTISRVFRTLAGSLRKELFAAVDLPTDFREKFVELTSTTEMLLVETFRFLDLLPIGDNATFSKTWGFLFIAGTDLFESDGGMTGRLQKRITDLTKSVEKQTSELEKLAVRYHASDPREDKSLPRVIAIQGSKPPKESPWFLYSIDGEKLFGKDPRKFFRSGTFKNGMTLRVISRDGYSSRTLDSSDLETLQLDLSALKPSIGVLLKPFTIYSGYYVIVSAGADHRDVTVSYRDTRGRSKFQSIGNIVAGQVVTLDPSDVNWTIAPNQTITIRAVDCVERTLKTDDMIK